jgi:type I restriction enzyme R subunit
VNEAETRAELIDPALRSVGWGVVGDSRMRLEVICPGRIEGAGRRGKSDIADYVLTSRNHKLAVIEAKARDKSDTEGVGQAKEYAQKVAGALRLFHKWATHLPNRHADWRRGIC